MKKKENLRFIRIHIYVYLCDVIHVIIIQIMQFIYVYYKEEI